RNIYFAEDKTLTVNGKLDLQGNSNTSGNRFRISGFDPDHNTYLWNLILNGSGTNTIRYVSIKGCKLTGNSLILENCTDFGGNQGWLFLGQAYEWTGASGTTDWNTPANWSPASIPGKGADVIIAEVTSPAQTLLLADALDLRITHNGTDYNGKITVNSGAVFDLAGNNLSVGTITNNGLVRLTGATGASTQTITAVMKNGTGSTVEYYGTGSATTNFAWDGDNGTGTTGKQYANLILNQDSSSSETLVMSENLTIKKTAALSGTVTVGNNLLISEASNLSGAVSVTGTTTIAAGTGKSVSLNNNSNTFTGLVTIGDSAAATPVNAGAVTLKAGSIITLANNANADSLELQSPVKLQNVTTTGNQTYSGTVETITGAATINSTAGNINFVNPVTIGFQTDITATTGSITFGTSALIDAIGGTQQLSLSSNSGTTFSADVGNTTALSDLSVTGPLNINCRIIKTSGNQTYNGAVLLGVTSDHNHTLNGTQITFENNATINGAENLTLSGTVNNILSANLGASTALASLTVTGPLQINCEQIKTTGNQTYNSTVSLIKNGDITLTAKNTSNEYQTIQFDGNISCAASVTPSIILDANTIINCANVTTTGTQTYNGTVQLKTAATITSTTDSLIYNDTVSIASTVTDPISLIAAATNKEIDFKNISGSGKKLIINSPVLKSIAAGGNISTISLSELEVTQDTSIQSQNTTTAINLTVPKISGTGKTVTLAASVSELSFNGNVEFNPNITTDTGSHLKASSDTMTFKADINFANNSLIANNGTIILTAANKTPAGTAAILNGNNTFNNLILQNSININGSNRIANFTAGTSTTGLGGKTITFGANTTQEVTGKLTLRGSENTDDNRLNLRSSSPTTTSGTGTQWEINCTGSNAHDIEFVDIQDSNNITSSYYLFALNSIDHGNNTKWNFPGMIYTWNGSTNNSWNNSANWTPSSIPGKGADVRIAAVTSPASTLLLGSELNLTDSYNGTPYNGTITVNSGAVFDLAGNNLSVGTITNNGLVRLTGASTQTITAAMNNGAASTVEYYGTGAATTNFAWDGDNGTGTTGKQYANLILNQDSSSSETLVMSENLTIKKPAALSGTVTVGNNLLISEASILSGTVNVTGTTTIAAGTGKSVSLNNASNTFTGHVTIGNSAASPAVNAGAVILNGNGSSGSAIFLENNVLADSLTLNSNIQGATLSVFTVSGPLTVNTATISTTENQTYNNEVRLTHNSIFSAPALSLIKFNDTLSSTNSSSCEIQNAASQFDGAVTNLSSLTTSATATFNAAINNVGTLTTQAVTFNENVSVGSLSTQAANLNYQTITTTTGGQTYNGAVTLGTDITLAAPANMLINFVSTLNGSGTHGVITSTADSQFDGQISGLTSLTTDATATFNADISTTGTLTTQTAVINTANINTSDNQAFQGTVTVSANANLTAPADKKIYFYNNVTGMGALTIGQTGGNSAPVEFRANISLASDQTYNSNVIINTTGTFSASAVSASGNIIFNKDIIANSGVTNVTFNTVSPGEIRFANSTVTILCPQTYNGPVNASVLTYPQADTINFTGTVTAGTLSITQAQSTSFEGAVIISTFNDTQNSGNISFNAGGTITAADGQIFNTQSLVTFGNEATDTLTFGSETAFENLTHTAGNTSITGTVRAANLTLANTADGPITITNSGFFTITENSTLNYSTSFTQNGSGKNTFAGSFTGNGPATFETDILLYGTAASTFGSTGNNITIGSSEKKNLIISREADCAINATLTTA
ncbi:MAG: hypothetical protein IKN54_00625, partial [Lachnospiraceae bacterium]|nr:hypothetical protein [Lachnospiraceae bacterium]